MELFLAFDTGVLSIIGNTPLVQLHNIFSYAPIRFYAKLEMCNPGGSIKDRTAYSILYNAFKENLINENTTIIESSSGNLGIGLAQVCNYLHLPFICVVDVKTTAQNINILKTFGATVEIVENFDEQSGSYLHARIKRVKELLQEIPNSFWSNQYANLNNPTAHHQTMREIIMQLNGRAPDFLFCSVSTCGTLRGCAEYLYRNQFHTKVIAVDAEGSVIFAGKAKPRLIPGHGAARVPELLVPGLAERCIHVNDLQCVNGCCKLLREESILAGGSTGAIISAMEGIIDKIPAGSSCVAIFPDRGERYLETVYNEDWRKIHFGTMEENKNENENEKYTNAVNGIVL